MCCDLRYFCHCCSKIIVEWNFYECKNENKHLPDHFIEIRKLKSLWNMCEKCQITCIKNCGEAYVEKRIFVQKQFLDCVPQCFRNPKNKWYKRLGISKLCR
jgi:hypothetical protein